MFPQKVSEQKPTPSKTQKSFLGVDSKTKWVWWQEEVSYLFIPVSQITEVKIVPATDGSCNVYARVDLKDRFEYKLIENKKNINAAKKLAEDFVKLLKTDSETIENKETDKTKSEKVETKDSDKIKPDTKSLNGLEALIKLKEELKF